MHKLLRSNRKQRVYNLVGRGDVEYLIHKVSSRVDNRGGANAHEHITACYSLISGVQHLWVKVLSKPEQQCVISRQ